MCPIHTSGRAHGVATGKIAPSHTLTLPKSTSKAPTRVAPLRKTTPSPENKTTGGKSPPKLAERHKNTQFGEKSPPKPAENKAAGPGGSAETKLLRREELHQYKARPQKRGVFKDGRLYCLKSWNETLLTTRLALPGGQGIDNPIWKYNKN